MKRGQRLVGLLWRWHRRTGVVIFLFVILLSVTGIVLNHSTSLGLDQRLVSAQWLISAYGDSSDELRAFPVADNWVARSAGGEVYLNQRRIAPCRGELVGAVALPEMTVAACRKELLLLTADGELIESVTAATGLPVPIEGIGLSDGALLIDVGGGWYVADLDALAFSSPADTGVLIQQQTPGELPGAIRAAIPRSERWLTWERVLVDLHSGRIAGAGGVWLIDAVGVLLICIASSGLFMWWMHRRRRTGR